MRCECMNKRKKMLLLRLQRVYNMSLCIREIIVCETVCIYIYMRVCSVDRRAIQCAWRQTELFNYIYNRCIGGAMVCRDFGLMLIACVVRRFDYFE